VGDLLAVRVPDLVPGATEVLEIIKRISNNVRYDEVLVIAPDT
jgi:hypothetical protein